jgi:hypothetical protein
MDASVARLPTALGRWTRDWLVDSLLAAALSALVVSSVATTPASAAYDFAAPNVWLVVLALAASLPLAARRRWPLTVLAVVLTATFLIAALRWNAGNARSASCSRSTRSVPGEAWWWAWPVPS